MRFAAALALVVLLALGTLGFGRISDDATTAMVLTAGWWAVLFLGAVAIGLRRRSLRLPLALAYAAAGAAAFIVLALPTLGDKTVNERVATAAPPPSSRAPAREAKPKPRRNVLLAAGSFRSVAHESSGRARLIRLARGGRVVTLTRFSTASGPDLRLRLAERDPAAGHGPGATRDLGALKGNVGNQQYEVPHGVDTGRYGVVLVWCRAFSVPFTSARLAAS